MELLKTNRQRKLVSFLLADSIQSLPITSEQDNNNDDDVDDDDDDDNKELFLVEQTRL